MAGLAFAGAAPGAGADTLPAPHPSPTRSLTFAPGRKAEAMKFLDSLPAHIRNDPVAVRTYLKELHRMRAPVGTRTGTYRNSHREGPHVRLCVCVSA